MNRRYRQTRLWTAIAETAPRHCGVTRSARTASPSFSSPSLAGLTCASAARRVSALDFELPYDLAVVGDGTIFFLDRSARPRPRPRNGPRSRHARRLPRERAHRARASCEDGTLFATDLPSNRACASPAAARSSPLLPSPMPVDLVVDPSGLDALGRVHRRGCRPRSSQHRRPAASSRSPPSVNLTA